MLRTNSGVTTGMGVCIQYSNSTKAVGVVKPESAVTEEIINRGPGTYHHSIIVGNLSESAADALGVNSLLARAVHFITISERRKGRIF